MSLTRAIKSGDVGLLPSRRDEDWKWTDLRGLLRVLPPASTRVEAPPATPDAGRPVQYDVINGNDGFVIRSAAREPYAVIVHFQSQDAGAHTARGEIEVLSGGHLIVMETYSGDDRDYVSSVDLTIKLQPDSRLERVVLGADGPGAVSVSTATVTLSENSHFAQTILTDGARRQRFETHVAHPGAGATVRLDGVYLLGDRRHADQTSVVTHAGVDGTTTQLTKGVVRDQARGVFQGRIVVAEGADRTDAKMGHHALILSDRAEVDAKPELEIFADDVSCAHGNTIGALDEDALFYAQQRGMPEAVARTLLTEAFVGEVVDRIEHAAARETARAWVAERLEG